MADHGNSVSRRRLLGTGATLGAASVLAPGLATAGEKPPPQRFSQLKPLYPAPSVRLPHLVRAASPI